MKKIDIKDKISKWVNERIIIERKIKWLYELHCRFCPKPVSYEDFKNRYYTNTNLEQIVYKCNL